MKWLNYILFVVLLIFSNQFLIAQGTVETVIDTNEILIGEQVNLHVKVTAPAQSKVVWPTLSDTLRKEIEIVSASKIDTSYDQDDITTKYYQQNIVLTSFDSGYWAVPPLYFVIDGDTQLSEPFLLTVYTVEVDTSQAIYDIKGPLAVNYTWGDWLKENWKVLASIVGGLLAIAFLVYLLVKQSKRKPEEIVVPKAPTIPAHEIALKKLEELKDKKLWQNDKTKLYHIELSEIVREYIELRFNIPALEQTTDEIMLSMRSVSIDDEVKAKLKQMLVLSDLVKFAKAQPISTENEMCMANAHHFVTHTTKHEVQHTEMLTETKNQNNA